MMWWRMAAVALALAATPSAAQARSAATIFDDGLQVCAAVVFDGAKFDAQIGEGRWLKTSPKAARSSLAVRAWRAMALTRVYLMELPNGGCSIFVMGAEPEPLKRAAIDAMTARKSFAPTLSKDAREGAATRSAYCTPDEFPFVMSMTTPEAKQGDVAFTLFRATGRSPSFCSAP